MFFNLSNIDFSADQLNAFKFRILVLCPELSASDLVEQESSYECYRTFLLSKDGESIIFMMVDVALGGIPKIGILWDNGDYMLNYDKALSHMVEFFYDAQERRPTTNIAIQPAQQRSIQAEVSNSVAYQLRLEMARFRTAHYDDGYEPVFDEDVLRDRVQLIVEGVYNFDYIPDL